MLKLTDIMCELSPQHLDAPESNGSRYFYRLTLCCPDHPSFVAYPSGGWDNADIPEFVMTDVFANDGNEYFRAMCRDLLNQVKASGLDVMDDGDTLPSGQWITPPESDNDYYRDMSMLQNPGANKPVIKLTDIMRELMPTNYVDPDTSNHTYSFSVTINNSGKFVKFASGSPDEHTFTACPLGGWSDASIPLCELRILQDDRNEYFRVMCYDLLCQIESSGLWLDVLDDGDTLPPSEWIKP